MNFPLDISAWAFPLIMFSALTHAIYNAMIKTASDKLIARMLMAVSSTLLIGPLAFFVPLPSPSLFGLLAVTALVHFFYQMAQIRALHYADYTLAYPVSRGTAPLLIVALSPIFVTDTLNMGQLVGIFIISFSILAVGLTATKANNLGVFYALLTGVAIAIYTLIDAKGVRLAQTPITFIVWFFIFDSVSISTFTITRHWRRLIDVGPLVWKRAALNGALGICTFGSALLAFRYGNAPVMAAMRETSVLFAAGIGYFFLAEKISFARILSIIGIGLGVVVIRLA